MKILWDERAWEEYLEWQTQDIDHDDEKAYMEHILMFTMNHVANNSLIKMSEL